MLINAILKNQIFILTLLLMFLAQELLLCQECTKKKKTLVNKNPKISKAERSNIFQSRKSQLDSHLQRANLWDFKTYFHILTPNTSSFVKSGYRKNSYIVTHFIWQPGNILITCIARLCWKYTAFYFSFAYLRSKNWAWLGAGWGFGWWGWVR